MVSIKYVPETNIHLVIKVEGIEVPDPNRLSNDDVIKIFSVAFTSIKDILGELTQFSMMNDKVITERSIELLKDNTFNVQCSFYWEKEYELADEIANFRSVELQLTNKIFEDIKILERNKKVSWVYPDIKNVRFSIVNNIQIELENDTEND